MASERITVGLFYESEEANALAGALRKNGYEADVVERSGSHRV